MASQLCVVLPLLFFAFFLTGFPTGNVKFGDGFPTEEDFDKNNPLQMVTQLEVPKPLHAPPTSPQFTHYILALQWPPSICTQEGRNCRGISASSVPKKYTIHGLWPSSSTGVSLVDCDPNNKFDWAQVMSLDSYPNRELSTKWPTLSNTYTQQAFLGKEWSKHGTCSGLTQFQYFQTALKLYDTVNVYNRLSAISVVPGTKKYNPATVVSDYDKKWGIKFQITCVNKTSSPLAQMIGEVRFRINKAGTTQESVTGNTNRCKASTFEYPARA